MRKLGLITALFALLCSSFAGCDNSPLDKKVKEEAKRTEKEKSPKLTKTSTESFNQSISQGVRKGLSLWMKL